MRAKYDKWLVLIPFLCYPAIFLISAEIAVYGGIRERIATYSLPFYGREGWYRQHNLLQIPYNSHKKTPVLLIITLTKVNHYNNQQKYTFADSC